MNKLLLEQMILEELMLEADGSDDEYKQLARELFPNIARRGETGIAQLRNAFKTVQALKLEKARRKNLNISSFEGDSLDLNGDGKVDGEDKNIINTASMARASAVAANPEIALTSIDDLLAAAAAASESEVESDTDTEAGSEAETETAADAETDTVDTDADAETDTVDTDADAETAAAPASDAGAAGTETTAEESPEEGDKPAEIPKDFTNAYNTLVNDFYEKTFLYEQGLLLKDFRDQLKTQKEAERTLGFTRPESPDTDAGKRDDLMEDNKLKPIKTKIKTFVAQYIKLNKVLKKYLEAAEDGLLKTKKLKKLFEKKLLDFMDTGKDLLESLENLLKSSDAGKRDDLTEVDEPGEEKPFQQVAKFIEKITSDFDNIVKDPSTTTEEDFTSLKNTTLQNLNKIIVYFPNAKPFATVADEDEDEINDYNIKFKEIYNDHLRGNIARFKEILSGDANKPTVQALVGGMQDFLVDSANLFGVKADKDGDAELTTEPPPAADKFGGAALEGDDLSAFIEKYRTGSFSPVTIDGKSYQTGVQIKLKGSRALIIPTTPRSLKDKVKFSPNRKYTIQQIVQKSKKDGTEYVTLSIAEQDVNNVINFANDKFKKYFEKVEESSPITTEENLNKKLTTKLEIIVEKFINKRKQQWQKRTM